MKSRVLMFRGSYYVLARLLSLLESLHFGVLISSTYMSIDLISKIHKFQFFR